MRTLRFHETGDPLDVLRLEETPAPEPSPGRIRIRVETCGLTPADWALCRGLFPGDLPRGVGLEAAGTVDAVGDGVGGVAVGDRVLGPVPFDGPSAGAAEQAVLATWFPLPDALDPVDAAALPMAVETAYRGIDELGVRSGSTVLVHGAGSTVGFAAAQIAVQRGARVIAAAGDTFAGDLRTAGAEVTPYGDGLADRVRTLADGPVDLVFDAAPVSGALGELVRTVDDPQHVLTVGDIAHAAEYGVRGSLGDATLRTDVIGDYARLAAAGRFHVPVARVLAFEDWREAVALSESGRARGKLVLRIAGEDA